MTDIEHQDEQPHGPVRPEGEIAGLDWRLATLLLGVVALGLFAGVGWLIMIGALVVMITLHELGHYLTAKWTGMKVTEFFLFFGPKIWSFKRGETEYGIKCIPLGAYVRILGMSNLETDVPPEDERRTYRQQSYPRRLLVVSAGSIMHFLQAFVLFIVAFAFLGVPGEHPYAERLGGPAVDLSSWTVGRVSEGSAAEDAGVRAGDDVLSIGGKPVATFDDVGPLVAPNKGDEVEVVVQRGDRRVELHATLGASPDDPERGFLGIGPTYPSLPPVKVNPVRGVAEAGQITVQAMGETVTGLTSFFTGGVDDFASDVAEGGSSQTTASSGTGVGGGRAPTEDDQHRLLSIFGIARIGAGVFEAGMLDFLILMAGVNVSIGILNLIPLLPLDGGHVAIATYERLRSIGGRRHMVDASRLLPLTYAVFMGLLLLGVSAIYLDIVDPIG